MIIKFSYIPDFNDVLYLIAIAGFMILGILLYKTFK